MRTWHYYLNCDTLSFCRRVEWLQSNIVSPSLTVHSCTCYVTLLSSHYVINQWEWELLRVAHTVKSMGIYVMCHHTFTTRSHDIFFYLWPRVAHVWHYFMFPTLMKIVWGSHFEFVGVRCCMLFTVSLTHLRNCQN
jgi:hypothetical protein